MPGSITKIFKGFFALTVLFCTLHGPYAIAYYGRNSSEAVLRFQAWVEVSDDLSIGEVKGQIAEQIKYLMGDFQSDSFKAGNGYVGMLGEDRKMTITHQETSDTYGNKRYYYSFEGKTVFSKKIFKSNTVRSIPLRLPLDLDLYYRIKNYRGKNPCTDPADDGYAYFWYYWDPARENCPLIGNDRDVVRVNGELTMLPNTQSTYPEYDRLYGDNGNGQNFEISIFLGYISTWDISKPSHWDDGAKSYKAIRANLLDLGFETIEQKEAFRLDSSGNEIKGANFFEVFAKRVNTPEGLIQTRIKVLLADTAFESEDKTFHQFIAPALENSDLMIFDGHSELGEALGFHNLPPIRFDQKKYQIFFFNGCNSYPYFNAEYIKRKGGSQNLEIITAGLPTSVRSTVPNVMAFIDSFIHGKTISYQTLLSRVETSIEDDSTLYGVSGDEDNVHRP